MMTTLKSLLMGMAIAAMMAGTANAGGIDDALQDHFGALSNTTNPNGYLDATGGGFSGGSLVIRNRIVNPQFFSLQKPHLNFGCGGWDIFGGSFSFISSEQLIQMLRSIASSAVSYAFRLALETISDDIGNLLNNMEDKMHLKNWFGKSSCELGKDLVENSGMGGPLRSIGSRLGEIINVESGADSDDSAGENPGEDESPASEAADRASEDVKELVVKGNLVWRSMNEQAADGWGGVFGGKSFMREMMSLTGTIIVCVPSKDSCPYPSGTTTTYQEGGQNDLVVYVKAPSLTLADLVEGSAAGSPIKIYQCLDGDDNCYNPDPRNQPTYHGARERLLDLLLGSDRISGLVAKAANPMASTAPTNQEKALMMNFREIYERVRLLAMRNPESARNYVYLVADSVAAEMVIQHTTVIFKELSASASKLENGAAAEDIMKMIESASAQMHADLVKIYNRSNVDTGRIAYYDNLIKNQKPIQLPMVP